MMYVMQEQIDACNAIMIFWGKWIDHSSHSPWLNYGCKIECLHFYTCIISTSLSSLGIMSLYLGIGNLGS